MFWTTEAYAMAGGQAGGQADLMTTLLNMAPLILMFAVFYFLLIRPQQKRAKEHKLMLGSLKRGDQVVTAGGIYGRIIELDDTTVVLDLGDSKIKIGRGFISALAQPAEKGK